MPWRLRLALACLSIWLLGQVYNVGMFTLVRQWFTSVGIRSVLLSSAVSSAVPILLWAGIWLGLAGWPGRAGRLLRGACALFLTGAVCSLGLGLLNLAAVRLPGNPLGSLAGLAQRLGAWPIVVTMAFSTGGSALLALGLLTLTWPDVPLLRRSAAAAPPEAADEGEWSEADRALELRRGESPRLSGD